MISDDDRGTLSDVPITELLESSSYVVDRTVDRSGEEDLMLVGVGALKRKPAVLMPSPVVVSFAT